ncbi:hypothetical protein Dimus_020094, partial [Dionaea muscipula]
MASGETGGNPQVRSSTTGGARVCAVNASTSGSGLDEGELAGDARVGVGFEGNSFTSWFYLGPNVQFLFKVVNTATEKSSRRGVKHCQFHGGRAIVGIGSRRVEEKYGKSTDILLIKVRAALFSLICCYHSPDNRALARECKDVKIDRVYIGSCTGGKTEDFLAAARVFFSF